MEMSFDISSLKDKKPLSFGAEAAIYKVNNAIVKVRPEKKYRLSFIDKKIRRQRTRREAKVISGVFSSGIKCPRLIEFSDKDMFIIMSFISGKKLRDSLNNENAFFLGSETGKIVSGLHSFGIVHQDLTTSNFILNDNSLFVIDFGLSFYSKKAEDRAVDIHLLLRAIESKHPKIAKTFLDGFFEGYKFNGYDDVLLRLKVVERRGRYKGKKESKSFLSYF